MPNEKFSVHKIEANNYTTRIEQYQGAPHIVVPVVMMVEGVHHGSCGPLLHTAEELGKFPHSWDGIPVSLCHPEENGEFISCNQPGVIDAQVVGRVFGTFITDDKKLRSELWLNQTRLTELSPDVLVRIRNSQPIEVSAGVFSDEIETPGEWNGEAYTAIATNHRPDHLALLLDAVGACSWQDGCGVRANQRGGENDLKLKANKQGYRERMDLIRNKLDAMDNAMRMHFLTEMYDDEIVFEVRPTENGGGEPGFFQQSYSLNGEEVDFTGDPIPVTRKVEYIQANSDKGGDTTMPNPKKKECKGCPAKVAAIIAHEGTQFVEADKEILLNLGEELGEEYLDKLIPPEAEEEPVKTEPEVEVKPKAGETETKPGANEEGEPEGVFITQEQLADKDKFLKLLPDSVRESIENGLAINDARRQELIAHIGEHTTEWTAKELEIKTNAELEKLAKIVKAPANYSVQDAGGGQGEDNEILFPTGVGAEEDQK